MVVKGTTQKFAKKKRTIPGIGASGTTNFQGVIDTEEYVTKLQGTELYTTVDKMRWSDASVQAALLMCELPIRAAEWSIEAGTEDAQGEEIAEFVKECLFDEMVLKWDNTLRQILLMNPYGVMVFEIIYKIRDDGKICWRKWAPRLPKTIEKWNVDKNGELESVMQRAYKNNSLQEFTIPIQKLMIFTNRQEGDNYLGTSLLRQAYKHWFFRDKYYKIDAVATERNGIGIPIVTLPEGFSDDDYNDAVTMAENVRGHEKAYIVKKQGWEFEFADQKASTLKDPKEMLEHHTREILKSILAQFIDLGGSGSGSYALAKDQSAIFLQSLDSSAKLIEGIVNKEIEKLVDFNYTVQQDQYPKLVHSDLGTKDVKEIAEATQMLVFSGVIRPDDKLEDYLRTVLKLPEKEESSVREKENQGENGSDEGKKGVKEESNDSEKEVKDTQKHSEKYHRPLTKAEGRVKFDEIRDYMDQAQDEMLRKMLTVLKMEQASLIPKFRNAIIKNDFIALNNIQWQLKNEYQKVFREQIKKFFEYGKLKASYEIKKPAPITTVEINKIITKRAFFLADRYEKMMMKEIKDIAAVCMMDSNISNSEAMSKVTSGFEKYNNRHARPTSALVTSEEINNGRKYTFDSFKGNIYGYQWSAILDGGTCNYCMSMDGKVIGVEDKAFSAYQPGAVHFLCRCIWVAIMKEEKNPPPFTGIPSELKPQSVMPAWNFKDLEYPLPGSGKRKMPYGVGVYKEGSVR